MTGETIKVIQYVGYEEKAVAEEIAAVALWCNERGPKPYGAIEDMLELSAIAPQVRQVLGQTAAEVAPVA